jgi:hypothetical protein
VFSLLTPRYQEKEARIKEGMLIMGMRPSVFWLGWAVTAVVSSLYVSILVILSGSYLASPSFFGAICHHPPGAYVVFAVSPVSLTVVTVGVYTLSVITLVFFVYSVANRSNFGRCSVVKSQRKQFVLNSPVNYSVGVLVFLVLGQ